MADKSWKDMTPAERRAERIDKWRNPGASFVSAEAEADYKARVDRLIAAINLEKADRVPVSLVTGWWPAVYAGMTPYEAMNDPAGSAQAWVEFTLEFKLDNLISPLLYTQPTSMFETIDYGLYVWPGHGVGKDVGYQYNEKEWMLPEEYDHLISDPTDYMLRTYLPRSVGAFSGFSGISSLFDFTEIVFVAGHIGGWGSPEMVEGLKRLTTAAEMAGEWAGPTLEKVGEMVTLGFPAYWGGATKAPFDFLGDSLRGTRGVVTDLYRCPEKVVAACERLVPVAIDFVTKRPGPPPPTPVIFMPLHKGADGFMSDEQFRKFYWPSLRATLLGLIEEGYIPFLFAEGGYNSRLDVIKELPKASTIWLFDQTDMATAKKTIGQVACIQGNVPLSLMYAGTAEETAQYVRDLIDVAGEGGGFVVDVGATADSGKVENLRAMVQTAKEYGRY